jgi:Prolyl oligopeptidase family
VTAARDGRAQRGGRWWRRPVIALAGLLVASTVQVAPHLAVQAGATDCTGNPGVVHDTKPKFGLAGRYAVPRHAPIGLAVFAHGYRNSSASWVHHLTDAADHGLVAVAVDYRGLGPAPDYRGWPAQAGAEDLVTAARYFLRRCADLNEVVLLGVSMGGNMSGLAVAADAKRADGRTPLWDYWIDTEGVTNWVETWAEATATAPGSAFSAAAEQDIEAEAGGTPVTAPDAYRSRDVLARVPDIAASGVKGVIAIHSVEDGLVPNDQTQETTTALRAAGVPTDVYNVLRRTDARDPGHEQTTLLSDAGFGDQDPFSGHAWEGSSTHIVMTTSMSALFALFDPTTVKPSDREFLVDGQLGTVPTP